MWYRGYSGTSGKYGFALGKEGEQYKFYQNINVAPEGLDSNSSTTARNAFVRYQGTGKNPVHNACTWWLRSPSFSSGMQVYGSYTGSCMHYNKASSAYVCPGFSI